MQASSDSAGMQVLTMDTMEIEAMTFDLDDTLYDNLPVIKKAVATMFSELEERYPKIKVAPDDFRAEMIGRQKSLSPDGGADLGALRHRSRAPANIRTYVRTYIPARDLYTYQYTYVRTYVYTYIHTYLQETCMRTKISSYVLTYISSRDFLTYVHQFARFSHCDHMDFLKFPCQEMGKKLQVVTRGTIGLALSRCKMGGLVRT